MEYSECKCGGRNQDCNICGGTGVMPAVKKSTPSFTDMEVRKSIVGTLVHAAAQIPVEALNVVTEGESIASICLHGLHSELEELQQKITGVYNSLHYYRLCHELLKENPGLVSHNAWHMKLSNINFKEQSSVEKAKKYSEIIGRQIFQYGTIEAQQNTPEVKPVVLDHRWKFNKYWHQLFPEIEFSVSFLRVRTSPEATIFFEAFNKNVKDIKYNLLLKKPIIGKKKVKVDLDIVRKKLITMFLDRYLTQETLNLLYRKYKQAVPKPRR